MNKEKINNLKKASEWIVDQHIKKKTYCSVPEIYGVESLEEAYVVQEFLIDDWKQVFGPVVGYKLALTSKPIQELVGLNHPCIGRLYKSQVLDSNQMVKLSNFDHLGIEFELAVRIGADMPKCSDKWTKESVKDFVKSVSAAFELIDDRSANYANLDVNSLVADNSWFGGAIIGEKKENWRQIDFGKAIVKKIVNNQIEISSTGAALGDPFNSVAWVANFLNDRGDELKDGQIIMTGSTFATMFPKVGDSISYEVSGVGQIKVKIS